MRLHVSLLNGSRPRVESFLQQALPAVPVSFDGTHSDGYDAVGILEVSEFDAFVELPAIIQRAGRNIVQAIDTKGVRVLCYVDRNPEIRWENDPSSW